MVLLLGGGVTDEEPLPLPLPGVGAADEPSPPPPPPHAVSARRNSEHAISPSLLFTVFLLRGKPERHALQWVFGRL